MSAVKIRQDGKGTWWVKVDHKGRRKSKRADNESHAKELADEIRVLLKLEGEAGLDRIGRKEKKDTPTVKDYAEIYKKRLIKMDLKPTTIAYYKGALKNHVVPSLGDLPIDGITRPILKEFLIQKVDDGLKRDTVRSIVASLSAMLNEAMDDGLVDANPALRLGKFYRRAEKKRERPDPFSRKEAKKALAGLQKKFPEYYEMFLTLYLTGMRPGEATVLKVDDLDFGQGKILIERNLPSNPAIKDISTTKSVSSERRVELDPELAAALKAMLHRRRREWLAQGKPQIPEWLFCDEAGRPHKYDLYIKRWRRVLKAAKVRYRSPGQMRHTFASLSLSEGKPLLWVSAQLGHKDPNVTLKKYARWMPREEEKPAGQKKESSGRFGG